MKRFPDWLFILDRMSLARLVMTSTQCGICLALLIIPHAVGQAQFTSSYQGGTVTGLVGSSVTFTWTFSSQVLSILWGLKKDHGIDDNGKLVLLDRNGSSLSLPVPRSYIGRVSGRRHDDASSGQANFTLSSITKHDERFYACMIAPVNVLYPSYYDSVYLLVEEVPLITHLTAVNTSYNEGNPVNITCKATGTPDPDVRWIHKGQLKSSGSKTAHLTFNTISKADLGIYTCRANNSAGRTEKELNIVVNCECSKHLLFLPYAKAEILARRM